MTVELDGADTLARTLAQAADQLGDLTGMHAAIGDLIVTAAGPLTPVLTGALRASTTAIATRDDTTIINPLRYAAPVNARTGFLTRAATSTEARQTAAAEQHIQHILDQVKGA